MELRLQYWWNGVGLPCEYCCSWNMLHAGCSLIIWEAETHLIFRKHPYLYYHCASPENRSFHLLYSFKQFSLSSAVFKQRHFVFGHFLTDASDSARNYGIGCGIELHYHRSRPSCHLSGRTSNYMGRSTKLSRHLGHYLDLSRGRIYMHIYASLPQRSWNKSDTSPKPQMSSQMDASCHTRSGDRAYLRCRSVEPSAPLR
jgi:hypothetical protein